jgi:hypothetical protein
MAFGRHIMAQRLRVFELARELGVSISVIIQIAESFSLPVCRGVAELTPRQEQVIRDEVERGDWRNRKRRSEVEQERYGPIHTLRRATCSCCGLPY